MEEKMIYKGIIFDLVSKDVKIKDKVYKRDIIRHPGGVGVICIVDGKILLVKQFRPAINSETLEIPAGKLEYGEDPMECGLRELNEETGMECEKLELLLSFVSTPGFCDERIWIYKAINPTKAKIQFAKDEDEEIDIVWLDLETAYEYTKNGKIDDGKTIIAISQIMAERNV